MTKLTLIIFVIFGALGMGLAAFVSAREKKARRERALSLITAKDAKNPSLSLDGALEKANVPAGANASVSAAEITKKLKQAAKAQRNANNTKSIASLIMQAGLNVTPIKFWIFSSILASLFCGILEQTGLSPLIKGLMAFTAYFGAPRFFLRFKAGRRQKAFLADFADALEAMIRLLKAGMPVGEAIGMVAREFSGPVGEEMARIRDAQKVGVPMPEAVRRMGVRMPLAEVQMFATAIAIQVQTGSSLSEVLQNLSGVIRARARLKRKVQALSSEAKSSAAIIGALPVLVSLALWGVNPTYIELLFTHPTGKMLLSGALIWMGIGILAMRQMINFKV